MRLLTNTNIMVDDFDFCKSFPPDTFLHFLTHFHSDHWEGLTPLWNYSDIYCTHTTKLFILNKFPKACCNGTRIIACELGVRYTVKVGVSADQQMDVHFWMFDAGHIPGAAMLLFDGYMGRILFTGDFRYSKRMVTENPILFPPIAKTVQEESSTSRCGQSIHIDEMVFDNTYCDPMFDFGVEDVVFKRMVDIIEKNKQKRCLIAMGALGKERLVLRLSQHFQTLICVRPEKYRQVEVSKGPLHILTTNPSEAFIQLIGKKHRKSRLLAQKGNTDFICIDTDFLMLDHQAPDGINFIVPYSLHSNYAEMSEFVRLIKPSILVKLVVPYDKFKVVRMKQQIDNRLRFSKYLDKLAKIHHSGSGYSHLVRSYTDITSLSEAYRRWMDPTAQLNLLRMLGLDRQPDHTLRKRKVDLQELQMKALMYAQSKKQSLSSIADRLQATNRNHTLESSFATGKSEQKQLQRLFDSIFSSD